MDIRKRLLRKPVTTVIWLIFAAVMTGFLTSAAALWYSSYRLADTIDRSHTAIAVRPDPAMTSYRVQGGVSWIVDPRSFTTDDAAALSAMPGVKAVRSHTLVGGSSPAFSPIIDLHREWSWRSSGEKAPYSNAVFSGRLVARRTEKEVFYSTAVRNDSNYLQLLFELEDILLLNAEYDEPVKNLKYAGGFIYWIDLSEDPEAGSFFEEGERYVVSGVFDPANSSYWDVHLPEAGKSWAGVSYFILDGGAVVRQDGQLRSLSQRNIVWSATAMDWVYETVEGSVFPAAEKLTGEGTAFFDETPHEQWRTYRNAWLMQNHALPLIGTDRLETMYQFVSGEAMIIEGRSFTPEEYETGARVLILSEAMAQRSGLSVGDTVPLSQYLLPETDRDVLNESGDSMNNPGVGHLLMNVVHEPAEEFTLVGVYRLQADWSNATYTFTPNTAFIPRKAQIPGGYGAIPLPQSPAMGSGSAQKPARQDVYGIYVSVELVNGGVEDFQLALEGSHYAGQFYCLDQGFETVQKNLNGLFGSSSRLLGVALGGWLLLLLLYLLLYQSAQRANLGIMRSLGASPLQAERYLLFSGALVALCGILLGTAVSAMVLQGVQNGIFEDMLSEIDRTAHGWVLVISEEELRMMVQNSALTLPQLAAIGMGQLLLLSLLMWLQARYLVHRSPRKLLEAKV